MQGPPRTENSALKTPQIPVTLPTYDEIIGSDGVTPDNYNDTLLSMIKPDRLNVLTIHAEVEGIVGLDLFEDFIKKVQTLKIRIYPLGELLSDSDTLPEATVIQQTIKGSLTMFYLAWDKRDSRKAYYGFLILSGIFCGLACLTKGFLAFAIPVCVIVPFVIWEGRWKSMFTIPWVPVSVALLMMLPRGIAIHLREPDFWHYFFWNEHIRRFMADNAQHSEPFYYFFGILIAGLFPWTVLAPAAVRSFISTSFNNSFKRFALCWIVFPFLFFSASSGKLATYILPCFPPLALLMCWGLFDFFRKKNPVFFNRSVYILLLFPIVSVTAVLLLQHGISQKMDELFHDYRKVLFFIGSTAWFALFLILCVKHHDPYKKIFLFALCPVLFFTAAHVLTPDKALLRNSPVPFIRENANRITPDAIIVAPSTPIRASCWALKRNDIFLLDGGNELSYGFSREDQKHRQLSFEDFNALVDANRGKRQIVLIFDERRYNRFKPRLPSPDSRIKSGKDGYFILLF